MRPWYINYSPGPIFPTGHGDYPLSYCLHFFFRSSGIEGPTER